jgi:hypothetical protein
MESNLNEQYQYTIYGLRLICNRPLPEAAPAAPAETGTRPVRVRFGERSAELPIAQPTSADPWYAHPFKDDRGVPALQVWRCEPYYYLSYLNDVHFAVHHAGDEIWAAWSGQAQVEDVTALILGPLLGLVLQLRQFVALHASVVARQGQALAILGASGTGKSTLAAELHRQGCPIVSDDIGALQLKDGLWWAQPGYPRLRLWPATAQALFGPKRRLRPIIPGQAEWDKRYLELEAHPAAFQRDPLPLKAIFVLNWSGEENAHAQIAPLESAQALANVDANSFMVYLLDHQQRQRQMLRLASMLQQVAVYQVQPLDDLAKLPDLGAQIIQCFEQTR